MQVKCCDTGEQTFRAVARPSSSAERVATATVSGGTRAITSNAAPERQVHAAPERQVQGSCVCYDAGI